MTEDSGQQPPQPQFNPQSGHPDAGPPAPPPPYPSPGANPYAGYAAPPPPPGWAPQQPGMPPFPVYAVPDLPKATAALVVGIVSVAGMFMCLVPILGAPVAWVLGAQARKQIRNAPQQWGGEGRATAGMVLGIVGTVLLLLVIIAIVVIVVIALNDPYAFDSDTAV
jgi:hypothetical protein